MKKLYYLFAATAVCFFSHSSIHAQNAEFDATAPKVEAARFMFAKKPAQACSVLEENYDFATTMDTDVLYLRGQCLQALGQHQEAIAPYERVLDINPNATAIRLPLANAYHLSGQTDVAQKELSMLVAEAPESTTAQNIQNAMAQSQSPKAWFARAEYGIVYDTNMSAGPDDGTIMVQGLPFTLASASQKEASFAHELGLSAGYQWVLNQNTAIMMQGASYTTDYVEADVFDSQILTASIGPTYRHGKWTFNTNVSGTWRELDDSTYSRNYGLNGRVSYLLNDRNNLGFSAGLTDNNYVADARDGTSTYGVIDWQYAIAENAVFNMGYTVSHDSAEDNRYENVKHGPSFGASVRPTEDISYNVNFSYQYGDYDGAEAAFENKSREDHIYSASFKLSYDIGQHVDVEGLNINLKANYTRADSNIEVYDYDRQTTTISLSKTW